MRENRGALAGTGIITPDPSRWSYTSEKVPELETSFATVLLVVEVTFGITRNWAEQGITGVVSVPDMVSVVETEAQLVGPVPSIGELISNIVEVIETAWGVIVVGIVPGSIVDFLVGAQLLPFPMELHPF
ncbi:hypothetical protein U1Q18_044123 [Sarracenia purpurea var. burkii]